MRSRRVASSVLTTGWRVTVPAGAALTSAAAAFSSSADRPLRSDDVRVFGFQPQFELSQHCPERARAVASSSRCSPPRRESGLSSSAAHYRRATRVCQRVVIQPLEHHLAITVRSDRIDHRLALRGGTLDRLHVRFELIRQTASVLLAEPRNFVLLLLQAGRRFLKLTAEELLRCLPRARRGRGSCGRYRASPAVGSLSWPRQDRRK